MTLFTDPFMSLSLSRFVYVTTCLVSLWDHYRVNIFITCIIAMSVFQYKLCFRHVIFCTRLVNRCTVRLMVNNYRSLWMPGTARFQHYHTTPFCLTTETILTLEYYLDVSVCRLKFGSSRFCARYFLLCPIALLILGIQYF